MNATSSQARPTMNIDTSECTRKVSGGEARSQAWCCRSIGLGRPSTYSAATHCTSRADRSYKQTGQLTNIWVERSSPHSFTVPKPVVWSSDPANWGGQRFIIDKRGRARRSCSLFRRNAAGLVLFFYWLYFNNGQPVVLATYGLISRLGTRRAYPQFFPSANMYSKLQ